MTTFARVLGGYAIDCQVHATATELAACFAADWLARNPFVVVPDGTLHGARDNGDGSFSNPAPVIAVLSDLQITRAAFVDYLTQAVGGLPRAGTIILAAKTATDPTVAAYWDQYTTSSTVAKQFINKLLTAMSAAQLPTGAQITGQERVAVTTNWPQG